MRDPLGMGEAGLAAGQGFLAHFYFGELGLELLVELHQAAPLVSIEGLGAIEARGRERVFDGCRRERASWAAPDSRTSPEIGAPGNKRDFGT